MTNLRIVSTNLATNATLAASTEAGALVIENMLLESKTQVWRSTGTTESITATFTSAPVSCVALPINNFTATATLRVRVYTLSGDGSPVLDTGNVLCCQYVTMDKIDFADGPLNANAFSFGGGTYASLYFAQANAEKVVIDIIDSANSNGYVEASNIIIGKYWSPERNADYGVALMFNDTSKHTRNGSGDLMTDRGAIYKSLAFNLGQMQTADRTELIQILIRNGMSVPLFISIFPESTDDQENQLYQLYGKLTKLGAIGRYKFGLDKFSVNIEEI